MATYTDRRIQYGIMFLSQMSCGGGVCCLGAWVMEASNERNVPILEQEAKFSIHRFVFPGTATVQVVKEGKCQC